MSNQIKSIKNIELSSLCNMSCSYCLSPHIKDHRKPGLMSLETFKKVADQIVKFHEQGTQGEVWLHGTGESLLNKDLVEMVAYLKSRVNIPVYLSTNGLLIDEDIVSDLKGAGIDRIDVSCHDEEVAQKAFTIISNQGIGSVINYGSQASPFDWAGQLDIETKSNNPECPWMENNECFVLHDGSIVNCCFDAFGTNIVGHINDKIWAMGKDGKIADFVCVVDQVKMKAFDLCKSCNHIIGESQ